MSRLFSPPLSTSCHTSPKACGTSASSPLGSLLHTAGVCSPAPRHPPHHGCPAQQHSLCHLPGACCCPQDQRCGHGHGGWHHHGNVSRYPADCTPAYRDWGTPCLHANIQGPGDPCVQLCAPALVKPAAHPNLESHIVCNYSSLTQVLEPSLAAPPLFARRDNRSARVTLCIFNGFGF